MSLNEGVFKDQRLEFAIRYDEICRIYPFYEDLGLWVALASLEVTTDALLEILCFLHIDCVISGIFEEVASRVFRKS